VQGSTFRIQPTPQMSSFSAPKIMEMQDPASE